MYVGVLLLVAALFSIAALAEDAVKADPEHYTVEFENDKVRIIRIKYGPGEKSVMHSHGPSVAVALTNNDAQMTFPDGTTESAPTALGDANWADAGEHLPANLSDEPLEVVLIELKE
jgi:uncharacterized RmlC-like cupin family protein